MDVRYPDHHGRVVLHRRRHHARHAQTHSRFDPRQFFNPTRLILVALLFAAGCATNPNPDPPTENGGVFRERNEGYSLIYKLMKDESDVSKILILKKVDQPIGDLIRQISTVTQDSKKRMDEFPKSDKRVEYDVADLPKVEQESRDLEAREDEHDLLSSSGPVFEQRLLFTQAQAMAYCANLCKSTAAHEDDPTRKSFLTDLATQCDAFHARAMDMLTVKTGS